MSTGTTTGSTALATEPEERCDPRFGALLRSTGTLGLEPDWMRKSAETVVGLWPDMTIACVNPAWFRFAKENGAEASFAERWTVGRNLLDAVPEVLRAHHAEVYEECLDASEPTHWDYECSTADRFRVFRCTAYPLGGGEGLLVVHSLQVDRPHDREPVEPRRERFENGQGMLTQCAYCRRFVEPGGSRRWLWVPMWVRQPPDRVTHGICDPCVGFYFGSELTAEPR